MKRFSKHITRDIYFYFSLILLAMLIVFPFSSSDNLFISFDASSQIVSVWGCIAAALYFISEYTVCKESPDEVKEKIDIKLLLKKAQFLCVMLVLFVILILSMREPEYTSYSDFYYHFRDTIKVYNALNPDILSKYSTGEAFDITDLLIKGVSEVPEYQFICKRYKGMVSVVLKNRICTLQYNVDAWFHLNKGVPWLGWDAYNGNSIKDYKEYLFKIKGNFNSPDLDSPYDGKGYVFFRYLMGPLN